MWRDGDRNSASTSATSCPVTSSRLRVGDIVPADLRLFEANQLECDEAVLTGESMAAAKTVAPTRRDSAVDLPSCAFMGTVVHQGSGRAWWSRRARRRRSARSLSGSASGKPRPRFRSGCAASPSCLCGSPAVLTISIFVINVAFSRPLLDALLFSLAIAIGITPQLLPAIVSVSLSTGSRELARRRVLVKRLVTIEDLGNIEVLFTDKTGTLTEGAITFDQALDPAGQPPTRRCSSVWSATRRR